MTEPKERLVQWLRDAHAMEEQAETILSGQIERLENYPEIRISKKRDNRQNVSNNASTGLATDLRR